jgi:hypothetical protein
MCSANLLLFNSAAHPNYHPRGYVIIVGVVVMTSQIISGCAQSLTNQVHHPHSTEEEGPAKSITFLLPVTFLGSLCPSLSSRSDPPLKLKVEAFRRCAWQATVPT